jgi:transcriptional regulator with XRE-family HTH domain
MTSIKEVLGKNLRENRRRCGFSQEKLAEKAGISTHYLAMIEIARNFPTSEILERLAGAMGIEVFELFLIDLSPRAELEQLRRDIVAEIKQLVDDALEKTCKNVSK